MHSLDTERLLILWELVPQRPHRRHPGHLALVEEGVPQREEAVPKSQGSPDLVHVVVSEEPGLAALGVYVGVGAEERLEHAGLVPGKERKP